MDTAQVKHSYSHEPAFRLYHICETDPKEAASLSLHYDNDAAIVFFLRGSGTVRIEGRFFPLHQGDIVLLNPQELHRFTYESGPHERLVLYLKDTFPRSFSPCCPSFFDVFYRRTSCRENLIDSQTARQSGAAAHLSEILVLSRNSDEWSVMLTLCRIVELVALLTQLQSKTDGETWPLSCEDEIIRPVLQFINHHYLTIPNTDFLAQQFFLSKTRLCRRFKECVGIPLWDYVILRRLLHSNNLIRGGISPESACYQSGFQNYSNFFRLYKKHFGQSPSESLRRKT